MNLFAKMAGLAAILAFSSHGASAEAQAPPIGGALAAKIIGEVCQGTLAQADIGELDRYVSRLVAEAKARSNEDRAFVEKFISALDEDYRSNRTCGIGDRELARDMVLRVKQDSQIVH